MISKLETEKIEELAILPYTGNHREEEEIVFEEEDKQIQEADPDDNDFQEDCQILLPYTGGRREEVSEAEEIEFDPVVINVITVEQESEENLQEVNNLNPYLNSNLFSKIYFY